MAYRCPESTFLCIANLSVSVSLSIRWYSHHNPRPDDKVLGILWTLTKDDETVSTVSKGRMGQYSKQMVNVESAATGSVMAMTYVARDYNQESSPDRRKDYECGCFTWTAEEYLSQLRSG